jgi:signal peptidase II
MVYYLIALFIFLLDQATKYVIATQMKLHDVIPVIGEFFQIVSHRNRGAAFGILQNQRWFFLIITTVIVVGIIWFLQKQIKEKQKTLLPFALSMLLGGAVGNFIDRALYGEVVDFLQFRFQFSFFGTPIDYTYPIFNVADMAIVGGVGLIFLDSIIDWSRERRRIA